MKEIDAETEQTIREMIYDYFSEECGRGKEEISDDTDIVRDLEGDSLMLLSLLELVRKKYALTIELKTLGRHLMEKPANTIGQVISLTLAVIRYGDDIVHVQL